MPGSIPKRTETDRNKKFIREYWGFGSAKEPGIEASGDPSSGEDPSLEKDPEEAYLYKEETCFDSDLQSGDIRIHRVARQKRLQPRTWISLAVLALVVPALLYLSVRITHGQRYLLCSLIIVVGATIPFLLVFEGRSPRAREIMVIAVLSAIGVAGRAAFFMVPSFKPVAAIVILAGVSFGGEAGFLCGCVIILVSNMFMGQGPWTPWQMFAYGMIGFLAGILHSKGILRPRRLPLCIYGFLSVIFIFGGIMNPASILMAYGYLTKETLLAYYISGLPMDLVQAASTVFFLWILARPMLEKLERIKIKYGLIASE